MKNKPLSGSIRPLVLASFLKNKRIKKRRPEIGVFKKR